MNYYDKFFLNIFFIIEKMYENEKYKVTYSIYATISIIGVLIIAPLQFYIDFMFKIDELSSFSYLMTVLLIVCLAVPHYIRYKNIMKVHEIEKNNTISIFKNSLLWIVLIIISILLWVYHP